MSRIEPLVRTPGAVWMEVRSVDTIGVAELVSLGHVPRLSARLPLGQLTRAFGPLHNDVLKTHAQLAFWRDAHLALLNAGTPIRVTIDDQGWARRPERLFGLFAHGAAPEARPRIALRWRAKTWLDHLAKHWLVEGEDGGEHFQARLVEHRVLGNAGALPIKPSHVKKALQVARALAPEEAPSLLPAAWWPLLELYAELTLESFANMLAGAVVHVHRQGMAPIPLLDEPEQGDLLPGDEELLVSTWEETIAIAQGEHDPMHWTTMYRRQAIRGWMRRRARAWESYAACQTHGL